MSLDDIIARMKKKYPLWNIDGWGTRIKLIKALESMQRTFADEPETLALAIAMVENESEDIIRYGYGHYEVRRMEERLASYRADIIPHLARQVKELAETEAPDTYNRDTIINVIAKSEWMPRVLNSYLDEFDEIVVEGILDGIGPRQRDAYQIDRRVVPFLERQDVREIIHAMEQYGDDAVYATSKALAQVARNMGDIDEDLFQEQVARAHSPEATKVYETYRDFGRKIAEKVISDVVWDAFQSDARHQGSKIYTFLRPEMIQGFRKAKEYGHEEAVVEGVSRIERSAYASEWTEGLGSEAFERLLKKYDNPFHLDSILRSILPERYGEDVLDSCLLFLRDDVYAFMIETDAQYVSTITATEAVLPEKLPETMATMRKYENSRIAKAIGSNLRHVGYGGRRDSRRMGTLLAALDEEVIKDFIEGYKETEQFDNWFKELCVAASVAPSGSLEAVVSLYESLGEKTERERRQITYFVMNELNYSEDTALAIELCNYLKTRAVGEAEVALNIAKQIKREDRAVYEDILATGLDNFARLAVSVEEEEFEPTPYLMVAHHQTDDKEALIASWKETLATFTNGNFDAENELHRNLEYTRFRRFIDHAKVRKYIKNHFTYENYESIFRNTAGTTQSLSAQDAFEVDCVAHEAGLLYDHIMRVKERADELGKRVVVVPNFSYGYLPVAPLVQRLETEGIEVVVGVKVGSTECHGNKEVMNSILFKGHRTEIVNDQPIVIVVDGTYNLDPTRNQNGVMRYPDAHQSYINQAVALNDANGFVDVDYSHVGKSAEDIERLRGSPEFQRAVAVYQDVTDQGRRQQYTFGLWNTAELDLAIRGKREIVTTVPPMEATEMTGPTLMFCNVGVLHDQIPAEIREAYPDFEHKPAYYDDSGRIIKFDYGHDEFGVRYLNRLETEVGKAFEAQQGEGIIDPTVHPAIVGALTRIRESAPYELAAK